MGKCSRKQLFMDSAYLISSRNMLFTIGTVIKYFNDFFLNSGEQC